MLEDLVNVDWRSLGFVLLLVVHHFDSDMFIAQCCFKACISEGPTGFPDGYQGSIPNRFI
jgi:hypothetical protein